MIEVVSSKDNERIFDILINAVKHMSGSKFEIGTPFVYNDGEKDVAVLIEYRVLDRTITFMSSKNDEITA